MRKKDKNGVIYYISPLFNSYNIPHMFSTRQGGVSEGVFGSLNFALGGGDIRDTQANVRRNHALAADVFGLTEEDICRSNQTHSSTVEIVNSTHKGKGISKQPFLRGVDGLATKEKNLILSIRTADCVPVLLYDYINKVCAAVHAGWRGTLSRISVNAIEKMRSLGAQADNIIAAIGPCVGSCCYEVGEEVYGAFISSGRAFEQCFSSRNGKLFLDLTKANELILLKSGIKEENISSADLCTCCNESDFFSHRRSGQNRGTMSALIVIE